MAVVVLGTLQDGGSPHAGCKKDCCRELFLNPNPQRKVVSLGITDGINKKSFLVEASPDITAQMKQLQQYAAFSSKEVPDGILLTHAHIGHYSGLMYLGREAMNAGNAAVYTLPRMKQFLETNGPWSQLVRLNNIQLQPLSHMQEIQLTPALSITAFTVPHRDEFSETAGFIIKGPSKKLLFIPDIDKWEKWETSITSALATVDYAFIDGTFYDAEEVNNRNMAEIPHPFITESMQLFNHLPAYEKNKIHFIHFNHTNPALNSSSPQSKTILRNGYHIAQFNQVIDL